MINTMVAKALRWFTIVAAIIIFVDAALTIYKTIIFRIGIDGSLSFFLVLSMCVVLLVIASFTGLGALVSMRSHYFPFSARSIVGIAMGFALIFLSANAFSWEDKWMTMVLSSKSESVALCVILCCMLLWLSWAERK